MKEFPKSKLLLQNHFVVGIKDAENESASIPKAEPTKKIWQFANDAGVDISVSSDTLSVSSNSHKTYRLGDGGNFRDVVALACRTFFEITNVPLVTRVGLRYIDDCPIGEVTTKAFQSFVKSALPLPRFTIERTPNMDFSAVAIHDSLRLRYAESLRAEGDNPKLILDFDAWTEKVNAEDVLPTVDRLHDLISDEFLKTVGDGLLRYMRSPA